MKMTRIVLILSMILSLFLCPGASFSEMIWTKNSNEIKEMKAEVIDLARKLEELTQKLSGTKKLSNKKVKELAAMIEGTVQGIEALTDKLKTIELESPVYQRVTDKRLAELQKSLNEYERRIISLEGELKELPPKIIAALEKINERIVETRVSSLKQEFKSGIEDTVRSIKAANSKVTGLRKNLEVLEREIGQNKAELRASQDSLRDEIGREIGTLEVRHTMALKKALGDYHKESASNIQSLEFELSGLKGELERLEEGFRKELALSKESVQEGFSTLTEEISGREKEREKRIAASFSEIEAALKERDKSVASLNEAIQRNAEERQSELVSLEDKIATSFNRRKEDISLLISRLSKELDKKGEDIDTLKSSLKELNDLMINRDLEVANSLKKFITESAGKKSEEMARLEATITGSLQERDRKMVSLITNISNELDKRSEESTSLRALVAGLNTRLEVNEKEVITLKDDVSRYLQKRDAELAALEEAITGTLRESSGEVSALISTISGRLKEIEAALDSHDKASVDLGKKVAQMSDREESLKKDILALRKNPLNVAALEEIKEIKAAIEREKRDNKSINKRLEKIELSLKLLRARVMNSAKKSSRSK